jgi:hypothetical protein
MIWFLYQNTGSTPVPLTITEVLNVEYRENDHYTGTILRYPRIKCSILLMEFPGNVNSLDKYPIEVLVPSGAITG